MTTTRDTGQQAKPLFACPKCSFLTYPKLATHPATADGGCSLEREAEEAARAA